MFALTITSMQIIKKVEKRNKAKKYAVNTNSFSASMTNFSIDTAKITWILSIAIPKYKKSFEILD
jgi:hypothetical protein